ncbi:TPA: two pore domain potassium channel family protein [Candidatus Micrarchaeota archaeon]|nr:two pore domain potassium channel family protein [Candidatus Micrarchaeota archaeon]
MAKRSYSIDKKNSEVIHQGVDFEAHYKQEIDREKARMKKRIMYAGLLLAGVYLVATLVFHFVEGWTWEDSVYFTTSTITTVGYGDLVPQSYYGKLFTIPLMLIGIGVGFYVIYTIQDYGRYHLDSVSNHFERIRKGE